MKSSRKYIERIRLFIRHRSDTLSFYGLNQYVDWHITMILSVLSFIAVLVVTGSLYIYASHEKDAFDISPEVVTSAPIQEDAIKKVLLQYEEKQTNFEHLKQSPYTYPNPEM